MRTLAAPVRMAVTGPTACVGAYRRAARRRGRWPGPLHLRADTDPDEPAAAADADADDADADADADDFTDSELTEPDPVVADPPRPLGDGGRALIAAWDLRAAARAALTATVPRLVDDATVVATQRAAQQRAWRARWRPLVYALAGFGAGVLAAVSLG